MRRRSFLPVLIAMVFSLATKAQPLTSARADSLYARLNKESFEDPEGLMQPLMQLEAYYKAQKDSCRLARVLGWRGNCYDLLGQIDSSLSLIQVAQRMFQPHCDSLTLMSINTNLTSVYLSLDEYDKVIALADKSLALWNPNWPRNRSKRGLFTNKAIALIYQGDLASGAQTFKDLLQTELKSGNELDLIDVYSNLGALYGMMAQNASEARSRQLVDSASYYIEKALQTAKRLNRTENVARQYQNLASTQADRGNFRKALALLDSSKVYAEAGGFLPMAVNEAWSRSSYLSQLGAYEEALFYLRHHVVLKDSMMNVEKLRAISEMQEKYESEKKERQIKELEVGSLNAELREAELTRTRNIYLFSGLGVLLLAGGLWGRLRLTRRAKSAIQKEKDISENLLLNILPEEVAEELKVKGYADAQLIDQVTVLFTDFKGFTALSEIVTPKQLVHDLHECFSAFDRICEKHGIEKIKTIGDAYMAAGGLPTPNITHAQDVVRAALAMAEVVEKGKAKKVADGLPFFEIRIGVHTGPVVAGIVGVKKFQYDIWGDTVNTASRMESSGAPGKVNISQTTYALLHDHPEFNFTARGKIAAKGKGEIEMLFVAYKNE